MFFWPGKRAQRKTIRAEFTSCRKAHIEKSLLPSSSSSSPTLTNEGEKHLVFAGYRCSEIIPSAPIGSSDNRFYWTIEMFGKQFAALIDPGAVASFLGPKPAALVAIKIVPANAHMTLPNGHL